MKVCKFGGSSLADGAGMKGACAVMLSDPDRRIVVVSAPGKRHSGDAKVTDLLIACGEGALEGRPVEREFGRVIERFAAIRNELGLPEDIVRDIELDFARRLDYDKSHRDRFLDLVKAAGEDYCAKFMTAQLCAMGADARYLNPGRAGLLLSGEYGNARLLPESRDNLAVLRESAGITVFPGFFGHTPEGEVVTFPRGGSDITGSILAASVGAELYENFTDVDSIFAANPSIVPEAKPIAELTYREMRELSYAGFGVLHDEAILPAVHADVPICVKNSKRPDMPGTTILPKHDRSSARVVGIAGDTGFCTIFVSKYLMNREVGFGRRLLQILEEEGLSYEHAPSGIDNMSVILRDRDMDERTEAVTLARIRNELKVDGVETERGLALAMIVGEGMRHTVGIASRATHALSDAGVNIEMMNQGSSEISMMFGVKAEDHAKAVRALYNAFFP